MRGEVVGVAAKKAHGPRKTPRLSIRLVEGQGVEGDAHAGATVMHRSRRRAFPDLRNLRQVHLLHAELFEELSGFALTPGLMGENITTRGLNLLALPTGAQLRVGEAALLEVTGLRNPCLQLDGIQPGLMAACLGRNADGGPSRKAGVMAIVLRGGDVHPGDAIEVELPAEPHRPLSAV